MYREVLLRVFEERAFARLPQADLVGVECISQIIKHLLYAFAAGFDLNLYFHLIFGFCRYAGDEAADSGINHYLCHG